MRKGIFFGHLWTHHGVQSPQNVVLGYQFLLSFIVFLTFPSKEDASFHLPSCEILKRLFKSQIMAILLYNYWHQTHILAYYTYD